jgi:hypothetical protein
MDEVNSSSSSSIGREENANHAFNASNRMKKSKLNSKDIVNSRKT